MATNITTTLPNKAHKESQPSVIFTALPFNPMSDCSSSSISPVHSTQILPNDNIPQVSFIARAEPIMENDYEVLRNDRPARSNRQSVTMTKWMSRKEAGEAEEPPQSAKVHTGTAKIDDNGTSKCYSELCDSGYVIQQQQRHPVEQVFFSNWTPCRQSLFFSSFHKPVLDTFLARARFLDGWPKDHSRP